MIEWNFHMSVLATCWGYRALTLDLSKPVSGWEQKPRAEWLTSSYNLRLLNEVVLMAIFLLTLQRKTNLRRGYRSWQSSPSIDPNIAAHLWCPNRNVTSRFLQETKCTLFIPWTYTHRCIHFKLFGEQNSHFFRMWGQHWQSMIPNSRYGPSFSWGDFNMSLALYCLTPVWGEGISRAIWSRSQYKVILWEQVKTSVRKCHGLHSQGIVAFLLPQSFQ